MSSKEILLKRRFDTPTHHFRNRQVKPKELRNNMNKHPELYNSLQKEAKILNSRLDAQQEKLSE